MFIKAVRRIRRGFTILCEQTYVSYASIAASRGFCDIDFIVIKATAPDDFPLLDKYVHQLVKIFSLSPSSTRSFSVSFTRRFGKTHSWRVALKCLILLHRLIRTIPESDPFRSELLWARSNGLLSLSPCRFRDNSSANYKHYTQFIKSYACLVDEALDCYGFNPSRGGNYSLDQFNQVVNENLPNKMNDLNQLIETLPQLMSLIDRVMDCHPSDTISKAFMIKTAMKHIIRDSFICYKIFKTEISFILDSLFQMPYKSCIAAFNIYKSAATQASQLSEFYTWCKLNGFCGAYEYPFIETTPEIHVQALETFLGGMWQLTDAESSSTNSSLISSPSNMTERYEDACSVRIIVGSDRWERFEENEIDIINKYQPPLIELDQEHNNNSSNMIGWETLLEASVKNILLTNAAPFCTKSGREIQVMHDHFHTHHHHHQQQTIDIMQMDYARVYPPSNPAYPWGL